MVFKRHDHRPHVTLLAAIQGIRLIPKKNLRDASTVERALTIGEADGAQTYSSPTPEAVQSWAPTDHHARFL